MRTRIALAAASAVVTISAGSVAGVFNQPAAAVVAHQDGHGAAGRTGGAFRALLASSTGPGAGAPLASLGTGTTHSLNGVLQHRVAEQKALAALAPPPPPPPPPAPVTDWDSVWTPDWQCIRVHESGDRFNSPAAPSGAYGIIQETWHSLGFSGWPYEASAAQQNWAALTLFHMYGWHPWSSRFACGL